MMLTITFWSKIESDSYFLSHTIMKLYTRKIGAKHDMTNFQLNNSGVWHKKIQLAKIWFHTTCYNLALALQYCLPVRRVWPLELSPVAYPSSYWAEINWVNVASKVLVSPISRFKWAFYTIVSFWEWERDWTISVFLRMLIFNIEVKNYIFHLLMAFIVCSELIIALTFLSRRGESSVIHSEENMI